MTPSNQPLLFRIRGEPWVIATIIFAIHAIIRFGGLWNPQMIPLSMVIIWPLPWLLSSHEARIRLGFRSSISWSWFLYGPVLALAALATCAVAAWAIFGDGNGNWFTQHATAMHENLRRIPTGSSTMAQFWIVTIPAMIFSPLAEEFLYRGYMLIAYSQKWNAQVGMGLQALAFALVHLAHYGLNPFHPALISVWLPSMFLVSLLFGWIIRKSGSIWVSILAHSVFNLGMNAIVFLLLPQFVGI